MCELRVAIAGFIYFGEGEGKVTFFGAKRWDRRDRADLIEFATSCHDAQVVWGQTGYRIHST